MTSFVYQHAEKVLYLIQYTICDSDINTRKHRIQESQEVRPFPANHKAARTDQKVRRSNMYHKLQKMIQNHHLGTVSNMITRGLKHVQTLPLFVM